MAPSQKGTRQTPERSRINRPDSGASRPASRSTICFADGPRSVRAAMCRRCPSGSYKLVRLSQNIQANQYSCIAGNQFQRLTPIRPVPESLVPYVWEPGPSNCFFLWTLRITSKRQIPQTEGPGSDLVLCIHPATPSFDSIRGHRVGAHWAVPLRLQPAVRTIFASPSNDGKCGASTRRRSGASRSERLRVRMEQAKGRKGCVQCCSIHVQSVFFRKRFAGQDPVYE